jgi:hypothetical protein
MATYANLQSKVYFLTKTNVTSFPNADMAILASNAVERVTSLINQSDGRWEFDDSNQTDLPIATTALVSGQQDYAMAVTHIEIERVELKDEEGNWRKLTPIDQADVYDQSITDFMGTNGTPMYYDKVGSSIFLYPTPDYSQSASLKVFFTRPPVSVLSSDISSTSTSPGFNALYHDLVAYWVAYDYAMANGLPNANQIMVEIQRKEDALKENYALRSKDEHLRLRPRYSPQGRGFFR